MTTSKSESQPVIADAIEQIRQAIDKVDDEIVELISRRAELARKIGALKDVSDKATFVPARERAVLSHVQQVNRGPLPNEAIRGIFQQIIAASRNLEQPVTVAYFGPEFTYTHQAALMRFGNTAKLIHAETIGQVVDLVEHGAAHYGVVPIENSTEGVVRETLDALYGSTLTIADELNMPIYQTLFGVGELSEVKYIYSHPQPLAQCRNWLRQHMPNAELLTAASTAKAAETVAGHPDMAAICSSLAAERHGLSLLADHIEDSPYNRTRFCVIGAVVSQPSGHDKTSLVFSVKHTSGSLNHVLNILESYKINMTLIESRPTKEMPWQYLFYVDFQGHHTEPNCAAAIEKIRDYCLFLRVLGSYPEAE